MLKLRKIFLKNLPEGFVEGMGYGMIGYDVPHSIYPKGYHCNPKQPLPFLGMASQKNFIAVYHMGIYASDELLEWFTNEYPKYCKTKADMGKSCIRFKKMNDIPYTLLAELATKMTVQEWIATYEKAFKRSLFEIDLKRSSFVKPAVDSNASTHGINLILCNEKAHSFRIWIIIESLVHSKNLVFVFLHINTNSIV